MHLQMNITTKAQYITANSGGTWVTTPYAYTSAPMSRFFSPYFEPHNLTTSRLSMSLTPGSWGSRVAGKTLLLGMLGDPSELGDTAEKGLGKAFNCSANGWVAGSLVQKQEEFTLTGDGLAALTAAASWLQYCLMQLSLLHGTWIHDQYSHTL